MWTIEKNRQTDTGPHRRGSPRVMDTPSRHNLRVPGRASFEPLYDIYNVTIDFHLTVDQKVPTICDVTFSNGD
jgi:hypothetical protein